MEGIRDKTQQYLMKFPKKVHLLFPLITGFVFIHSRFSIVFIIRNIDRSLAIICAGPGTVCKYCLNFITKLQKGIPKVKSEIKQLFSFPFCHTVGAYLPLRQPD